jgi:hypothetical protein
MTSVAVVVGDGLAVGNAGVVDGPTVGLIDGFASEHPVVARKSAIHKTRNFFVKPGAI